MLTLERTGRARKALIWTLLAVWAVFAMQTAPRRSFAQDADKAATDKAPEKAAEPAAAAGGGDKAAPAKEPEDSIFLWVIKVSGLIGLVILCLSIYFVATISRLFIEMRPVVAMPPEIIARCEALLEQRDFKSIFGVVKDDNSFFSTALSTGIAELPNGLAEAREAMEKVGESVTVEMEKKISMLAVLGTLGPMIGLVGTLKGMITAFSVIARSGQGIDPGKVANAISEALVLTFEGVILGGAGNLLLRLVPQPGVDDFRDDHGASRSIPAAFRPRGPKQSAGRRSSETAATAGCRGRRPAA